MNEEIEFLDMESMVVLADEEGIFSSSMSDSTRAMVTENAKDILVVVYCFEDEIDLEGPLYMRNVWRFSFGKNREYNWLINVRS